MKNLLLIAFHFPPYKGGSGVHRAAKFFEYLPENGWSPHVLTTGTLAYENVRPGTAEEGVNSATRARITRTVALDAQRHLAVAGKYFKWSTIPDRWANWVLTAVPAGLVALYRSKISVILVTFPIATAVLIGLILHRLTGKPLIIDFRDSMTEDTYPRDPMTRSVWLKIEKAVIKRGARFIFTTESTRRMYLNRYPQLLPECCVVIPNGYDEEDFAGISAVRTTAAKLGNGRPLRLVHAGLIYPEERDPRPFFKAVGRLKAEGVINAGSLRIELRASGSENLYSSLLQQSNIQDIVNLLPSLPHRAALEDIAQADGLLLFQAASCNHQIPAKVYEYLRVGRPILALTSAKGDTAALLTALGGATIVDLADENAIHEVLPAFINRVRDGTHTLAETHRVRNYSRRSQAAALAQCMDQVWPVSFRQTGSAA
jgi:glycosyltransferase involved in cell wall biosynthesis